MSKPREKWWGYIKNVIWDYPNLKAKYEELHTPSMAINLTGMPTAHNNSSSVENVALRELPSNKQAEYDAVNNAIKITSGMNEGKTRLLIIHHMFWGKQTYSIHGAAMMSYVSYSTAKRYYESFMYLVADKLIKK